MATTRMEEEVIINSSLYKTIDECTRHNIAGNVCDNEVFIQFYLLINVYRTPEAMEKIAC